MWVAGRKFMYIGAALLSSKGRILGVTPPSKFILATIENHLGESDLLGRVCNPSYFGG